MHLQSDMVKQMVSAMLVCGICFLPLPLFAADAGIIKTVKGQVQIERADSSHAVKVGDFVRAGDRVNVKGEGSIGISLKDETLLSIGPNSTLVIDNFDYDPTTREGRVETSIVRGTLRFVTGLIGKLNPKGIKVMTPTATCGIRGTDFIVDVPDER